ncbi:MAG: sigma-70 family RNA polymerase sigma factor [Planctomycetales bacterium]|nr:sigma-70 family RNA polymerase sigma factor [Planctomycetales bacterium]
MHSTSINLLKCIREHNSDSAWERFVCLYAPLIFCWARGKGLNTEDASDIVQDVLSTLVVKLPEFDYNPDRKFRSWLKTITLNRTMDFYRRRHPKSLPGEYEAMAAMIIADDADLFVESEYRGVVVNRALELLKCEFNEATWEAFWMQVMEDQKAAVVAERLQLPVNSVYLAKSRVLARLRQELEGLLD